MLTSSLTPASPDREMTVAIRNRTRRSGRRITPFSPGFANGPAEQRTNPILLIGDVSITPGAQEALNEARETSQKYLLRHQCGDWGDLDSEDWAENDRALREKDGILSAYHLETGVKIWIVTERDRSVTTILLPDEN